MERRLRPGEAAEPGHPGTAMSEARDDVDRVIAAWQRERPDLDLAPLAVLSRVSRLARRLDRAREQAFAAHSLAVWEFDVLVALRRTGAPYRLTPGQLLDETLVTSGTMTNRIDRLAERGLVVREPVLDDRRGTWVALTAAGRAQVDGAFEDLLDRGARPAGRPRPRHAGRSGRQPACAPAPVRGTAGLSRPALPRPRPAPGLRTRGPRRARANDLRVRRARR